MKRLTILSFAFAAMISLMGCSDSDDPVTASNTGDAFTESVRSDAGAGASLTAEPGPINATAAPSFTANPITL